jgi:hypothetical protein
MIWIKIVDTHLANLKDKREIKNERMFLSRADLF